MERKALSLDELTRSLKEICDYNNSTGEFLLPIIYKNTC